MNVILGAPVRAREGLRLTGLAAQDRVAADVGQTSAHRRTQGPGMVR